jgi:hypothetical protein
MRTLTITVDEVDTVIGHTNLENFDNKPIQMGLKTRNIVGGLISYVYGQKKEISISLKNISETTKLYIEDIVADQTEVTATVDDELTGTEIDSMDCILACGSYKYNNQSDLYDFTLTLMEV